MKDFEERAFGGNKREKKTQRLQEDGLFTSFQKKDRTKTKQTIKKGRFKNTVSHAETQLFLVKFLFCYLHPIPCKSCVWLKALLLVFSADHSFCGLQIVKTLLQTPSKTPLPKHDLPISPVPAETPIL